MAFGYAAELKFEADYIYVSVAFVVLWLFSLYKNQAYRALVLGVVVGMPFVYVMEMMYYRVFDTRHVDGPVPAGLALLFLAGEAGVMRTSFLVLVLENWICAPPKAPRRNMVLWTLFYILVVTLPPFIAQTLHIHDDDMTLVLDINHTVWLTILFALLGYMYLSFREIPSKMLLQMTLSSIFASFLAELALLTSGIRPWNSNSILVLMMETILGCNVMMPYIFIMWRYSFQPKDRPFYSIYYPIQGMVDVLYGTYSAGHVVINGYGSDNNIQISSRPAPKVPSGVGMGDDGDGDVTLNDVNVDDPERVK